MPISILRGLACDFRRVYMSSTYLTFNAIKRRKSALKSKYGHITRHDIKTGCKTVSRRREKIGERWTIPETKQADRSSRQNFRSFHRFQFFTVFQVWPWSGEKFRFLRFLRNSKKSDFCANFRELRLISIWRNIQAQQKPRIYVLSVISRNTRYKFVAF